MLTELPTRALLMLLADMRFSGTSTISATTLTGMLSNDYYTTEEGASTLDGDLHELLQSPTTLSPPSLELSTQFFGSPHPSTFA